MFWKSEKTRKREFREKYVFEVLKWSKDPMLSNPKNVMVEGDMLWEWVNDEKPVRAESDMSTEKDRPLPA